MGGTEWACAWHCLRTSRCLYQGRALGSSSSPPCSCIYLVIMMTMVISTCIYLLAGGPCIAQQRPCQCCHRGFLGWGCEPMSTPWAQQDRSSRQRTCPSVGATFHYSTSEGNIYQYLEHNLATYNRVFVPYKIKRHLLKVCLCAGHLFKGTEAILVTSSMVVPHPPGHPWR